MLLLVAVSMLSSMAAQASTGLLPVDASAMGQDEARVRRGIIDGARDVLKGDAVIIDAVAGGMVRCSADPACLRGLMDARGVDALAAFVVTPTTRAPAWAEVRVVVYDINGVASFRSSQPLATDTDLQALMVRTFDPARFTARLDVLGVEPGDAILVDGLGAASTSLLRAGHHTVVIVHRDGTNTTLPVDLGYQQRLQLEVPAWQLPGQQLTTNRMPLVIGGVVAGVAVVGVAAGVVVAATSADQFSRDLGVVGAVVAGAVATAGLAVVTAHVLAPPAAAIASPDTNDSTTNKAADP
jgi:hypothetical protein